MIDVSRWDSSAALWAFVAFGASIALCAGLIVELRPLLQRYALARPNARSSHRIPTAQGGGIAVLAATIGGVLCFAFGRHGADASGFLLAPHNGLDIAALFAAALALAIIGAVDDIRVLDAAPRFIVQVLAVGVVVFMLPQEMQIVPALPLWAERVLLALGGIWFVNLVNFMDGIDWMTVAEVVPVTLGVAIIGLLGGLPTSAIIVAIALCGAMLGFAPFNKPVASLFLGDVGSLPIGLITGWLLLVMAEHGHWAAAILLPLYYLADATITLFRRLAAGERMWQAHREHFYQRATHNGLGVTAIVSRVFVINVALAALAIATVIWPDWRIGLAAVAASAGLVLGLLAGLARSRPLTLDR